MTFLLPETPAVFMRDAATGTFSGRGVDMLRRLARQNPEQAIDLLEVDRIDHGYTVLEDPALTTRCAERGILFTVVPTNSYYLRTLENWPEGHPLARMPAAGLLIHPNTDDPPLHQVTPTRCWRRRMKPRPPCWTRRTL